MTKNYTATIVDTNGKTFTLGFAADSMALARDHANHATKDQMPGAKVTKVARTDGLNDADMGVFLAA